MIVYALCAFVYRIDISPYLAITAFFCRVFIPRAIVSSNSNSLMPLSNRLSSAFLVNTKFIDIILCSNATLWLSFGCDIPRCIVTMFDLVCL